MTRAIGLIFLLALAGCSGIGGSALKGVAGAVLGADSGPSLDVQAGKTNNRSLVGGTETTEQKFIPKNRDNDIGTLNQNSTQSADTKTVETQSVESLTVNEIPTWLMASMAGLVVLFGVVGWFSPQPKWIRGRSAQ